MKGKELIVLLKFSSLSEKKRLSLPSCRGPFGGRIGRRLSAGYGHRADRSRPSLQCRSAPSSCLRCPLPRKDNVMVRESQVVELVQFLTQRYPKASIDWTGRLAKKTFWWWRKRDGLLGSLKRSKTLSERSFIFLFTVGLNKTHPLVRQPPISSIPSSFSPIFLFILNLNETQKAVSQAGRDFFFYLLWISSLFQSLNSYLASHLLQE